MPGRPDQRVAVPHTPVHHRTHEGHRSTRGQAGDLQATVPEGRHPVAGIAALGGQALALEQVQVGGRVDAEDVLVRGRHRAHALHPVAEAGGLHEGRKARLGLRALAVGQRLHGRPAGGQLELQSGVMPPVELVPDEARGGGHSGQPAAPVITSRRAAARPISSAWWGLSGWSGSSFQMSSHGKTTPDSTPASVSITVTPQYGTKNGE